MGTADIDHNDILTVSTALQNEVAKVKSDLIAMAEINHKNILRF